MHTILAGTIATPPDENSMFEVWLGDDGQRYQPGSEVKITQNLTLTAIWKNKPADAVNYTLTFDPNQQAARWALPILRRGFWWENLCPE